METAVYEQGQRKRAFARATETEKPRARPDDDRRSFVQSNLVAVAPSPDRPGSAPVPSLNARARATGLPMTTAKTLLKDAAARRAKLTKREEGISWSSVEARKGHSKITKAVKEALHGWVLDHPRVVNSPIANDTGDTLLVDVAPLSPMVSAFLRPLVT